jgi:UDP-N-acetylmuramoylalanine--D-glutamate ligase
MNGSEMPGVTRATGSRLMSPEQEARSGARGAFAGRQAVVVGLGRTGLSAVRYLAAQGARVAVTDSRADPPGSAALAASGLAVRVRSGGFDAQLLEGADLVVLSPGVAPVGAFFDVARARGLPLVGDVELFAQAAQAPVAAITGTNGKSTVTTLLGEMAAYAGRAVRVGGNLGPPALELLDRAADLYVLELSSFQLEATVSLQLAAAAVLNVSPDHLDRYPDVYSYATAKARIFRHCARAVINLDDPLVSAMPPAGQPRLSFSLRSDSRADYRPLPQGGELWLSAHGEALLPLAQLRLSGLHNAANALAALALAEALGLPRAACLSALRAFGGLAHRMQWVREVRGVRYIDDSKGTNVGATLAAVQGLTAAAPVGAADAAGGASVAQAGEPPRLIVIAGGDGKGQDFTPLQRAFAGSVRCALLIGRDAALVGAALAGACACEYCASLPEAVTRAAQLAQPGDTVLLSPACASLDMFRDYAQRGAVFAQAVRELRS